MADDRGQSTAFAIVAAVVIIMSMAILGVLFMYLGAEILVPINQEIVQESQGAQDTGFDGPAQDILEIGLGLAMPLTIAAPVVVYFLVLRLRSDAFIGRR